MTAKKIYLLSLGIILLASAYPIYMGVVILAAYIVNGGIDAADYPSYIIPYTPICIAVIFCAAFLPLVYKLFKKFTLPILSVLGAAIFLGAEIGFEQIAVFADSSSKVTVEMWQLASCIATPQVKAAVWDSLSIRYNPAFKIHFYAIALLIVLAVTGVVYGFYKTAHTRDAAKKKPLVAQFISIVTFIGLCLLACFTAFFRAGDINISPVSAFLMTVFFIVFGVTAGVYAGTWLYGRRKLFSIIIPSVTAMLITVVMYIGEMVMMDLNLFRRGNSFLFRPLGAFPLSIFDIITIILSGIITYFILTAIKPKSKIINYDLQITNNVI